MGFTTHRPMLKQPLKNMLKEKENCTPKKGWEVRNKSEPKNDNYVTI